MPEPTQLGRSRSQRRLRDLGLPEPVPVPEPPKKVAAPQHWFKAMLLRMRLCSIFPILSNEPSALCLIYITSLSINSRHYVVSHYVYLLYLSIYLIFLMYTFFLDNCFPFFHLHILSFPPVLLLRHNPECDIMPNAT